MRGLLLTITVTTNSCTKETLCSPGVGCVRASLDYGARDTLDCTLVINTVCGCRICHSSVHKTHALYKGVRIVTAQSTRHMHYIMTCLSGDCVVLVTITVTTNLSTMGEIDAMIEEDDRRLTLFRHPSDALAVTT